MARTRRNSGGKGVGGRPLDCPPSQRIPCPTCDMPAGARCVTYRISGGERLYVKGYRIKNHPARTAAARQTMTVPGPNPE
jgi:hypothetical protein